MKQQIYRLTVNMDIPERDMLEVLAKVNSRSMTSQCRFLIREAYSALHLSKNMEPSDLVGRSF
jgi:hypothetical protein